MSQTMLPPDWRIVSFGKACRFTQKPRGLRYSDFEAVPFIPMEVIPIGRIDIDKFVSKTADELTSGTYFEAGDVLVAKITPSFENGKQGIATNLPTTFGVATTEVIPFRELPGISDKLFLFYSLLRQGVRSSLAEKMEGSTGRQRLSKSTLEQLEIPLPPLPQQCAIARVLRAVQKVRELRQKEIALERQLKAALMRHLFTRGTRGEARKQTEIGEMPESWQVVKLEELVADGLQNGVYKPQELYGEGSPIIRINDFDNEGKFVTLHLNRVQLQPDDLTRYQLSEGDILINRVNSLSHLGKCALVTKLDEPTVFESNMMRLRIGNSPLRPGYLACYLLMEDNRARVRGMARRAVAQSSINQGDVKSLPLPFPSPGEQMEIESALNACDKLIAALEKESVLLDELFRALLEKLMTGKLSVGHLIEQESSMSSRATP